MPISGKDLSEIKLARSRSVPRAATCLACGYHVAVSFYCGGAQPLATLAWPMTSESAQSLTRQPLDFVRCVSCGHVFNAAFNYDNVPYSEKPNLMFNSSHHWSKFLSRIRTTIIRHLPESPTVVEIGHGDGSFLSALSDECPGGQYVGFDPHGTTQSNRILNFRAEMFDPVKHLAELKPDLIISRHVLEHLSNALGFLQHMSFGSSTLGTTPLVYLEVPCIDAAISGRRTVDFYYEHSSQFTTNSFTRMLTLATKEVLDIGHDYGGEVVFGFAKLGVSDKSIALADEAHDFFADVQDGLDSIRGELEKLLSSGKRVAIWGGTGKSAAFMCRYGVDAKRFPLVVDSDCEKVGSYVPGTGQEIRFRDYLLDHAVDVIIIPPQWRVVDIVTEMARTGIAVDQVLIEHLGHLVDFHRGDHPYTGQR